MTRVERDHPIILRAAKHLVQTALGKKTASESLAINDSWKSSTERLPNEETIFFGYNTMPNLLPDSKGVHA